MNVEAQQFLAGAKTWFSWSTSTALVDAASALQFKLTEEVEALDEIAAQWTFARTYDNKYVYMSSNGSYFNRPGWGEMHVDMASQGHNYFELLKQDNGYYHIRIAQEDVTYGEVAVALHKGHSGIVPASVEQTSSVAHNGYDCYMLLPLAVCDAKVVGFHT